MRILLLLAGVMDPKWPLDWPAEGGLPPRRPDRVILSPFDEAALELALRLRDMAGVEVRALVIGAEDTARTARTVAAFRVETSRMVLPEASLWDVAAIARAAIPHIRREAPDLLLIGREFGDHDDGTLPAYLAGLLDRPCFTLAQEAACSDGRVRFMRERADSEEWVTIDRPAVVSVTNDRRNRLRKPLMKNVMAARQAELPEVPTPVPPDHDTARLLSAAPHAVGREQVAGRVLSGPVATQVAELAHLLRQWQVSR